MFFFFLKNYNNKYFFKNKFFNLKYNYLKISLKFFLKSFRSLLILINLSYIDNNYNSLNINFFLKNNLNVNCWFNNFFFKKKIIKSLSIN